jgi:ATP-binding protein involved in chromosome partitioning
MSEASITEAEVLEALNDIVDPEIGRPLSAINMLKGATVAADGTVEVHVELPVPVYPNRERISEAVRNALKTKLPAAGDARVSYSSNVKGLNTGGSIGLQVRNVVAVGSGKGGVGKSTIAAAIAFGLKAGGARVGLMDADVYGPSIPHLVGVKQQPAMIEKQLPNGEVMQKFQPLEVDGLKLMSMGFLVPEEQAVIWRGPMLHKALTQFLQQTEWGELDYLIIDMPPGTGDVSLTLSQLLGLSGAVVVCTPQQVALLDAVKAINMFKQVKIPVLGIVENMSGEIFGRGGAKKKAVELGVPFLGEVPIEVGIRIKGDDGKIAAVFDDDSPSREPLQHVCERVAVEIAKQLLGSETPQMPSLEIL